MRFISSAFLILFSAVQLCFAQDSAIQINSAWANLKTQLERRTDIVAHFSAILDQSTLIGKKQLARSRMFAVDLFKYIDTLNIKDSLTIGLAKNKNDSLRQELGKALPKLIQDPEFRNRSDFMGLIAQLEGINNRIVVARKEYNDLCKKFKRFDLLFDANQIDKPPAVIFQ